MMVDAINAALLCPEWGEWTLLFSLLFNVFRTALHFATVEMVDKLMLVARSVNLQSLETYILQQQHVENVLEMLEVYGLLWQRRIRVRQEDG